MPAALGNEFKPEVTLTGRQLAGSSPQMRFVCPAILAHTTLSRDFSWLPVSSFSRRFRFRSSISISLTKSKLSATPSPHLHVGKNHWKATVLPVSERACELQLLLTLSHLSDARGPEATQINDPGFYTNQSQNAQAIITESFPKHPKHKTFQSML